LSAKLNSLVQATNDFELLDYVFTNLGRGVSPHACFSGTVDVLRKKWLYWLYMKGHPALLDRLERQLATELFQLSSLTVTVRQLADDPTDTLQQKLKGNNRLLRFLAVDAIGRRHCHLEADLIECLKDPDPAIRNTAHKSLVRVARGTDFGPQPGFSQRGIARSIEKWRHWLALQNGESPETIAKAGTPAETGKPGKLNPDKAITFVLGHEDRTLQTAPPEVMRLCDELVKAKRDEQLSVLERLRDAKGIDHTDALALAIPRLGQGIQSKVRDALAQRLTRMTAATLRNKLQDDSAEVRRAAALACGRKKAQEHIPDLLQLLDDPEVVVIQAARKALQQLTGEDFGPSEETGRRGRIRAAAAWRHWWKEHQSEQK
jgi:hypothetical protein